MKFIFIRHGNTKSNIEKRYLGRTDETLSESGRYDIMQKVQDEFYPKADICVVSPMRRCVETADIIYPKLKKIIANDLREMDFGVFEGFNYKELNESAELKDVYQQFIDSNGTMKIPGGESKKEFMDRTCKAFSGVLRDIENMKFSSREITVAVVVHGGTIMAVLSHMLGGEYYDYQIGNGEYVLCDFDANKFEICKITN